VGLFNAVKKLKVKLGNLTCIVGSSSCLDCRRSDRINATLVSMNANSKQTVKEDIGMEIRCAGRVNPGSAVLEEAL
jgi:hypothetical protein